VAFRGQYFFFYKNAVNEIYHKRIEALAEEDVVYPQSMAAG